ncbi:MAG TPA: type I methionyl aminopeptidase [Planctomycetota bacterium]|nr:type I methionyl aminopeptidase [Planctomycetota bacterium]
MTVHSRADLRELVDLGALAARVLGRLARAARPGATTRDLDAVAARLLRGTGAVSAPRRQYAFPGNVCLSKNDEIVHGVPGGTRLRPGDVLKVDVTLERGGYVVDTACTVLLPGARDPAARLAACARRAFAAALFALRPDRPLREVGRAVEREARASGFFVLRELQGHGLGPGIHEPPAVPNFDDPYADAAPEEGLVLAVEPILAEAPTHAVEAADGWTLRTSNGALAVHHEHTVVVRDGPPLVVTREAGPGR